MSKILSFQHVTNTELLMSYFSSSFFFLVGVLYLQYISIQTSHISRAQEPLVGQHRPGHTGHSDSVKEKATVISADRQ